MNENATSKTDSKSLTQAQPSRPMPPKPEALPSCKPASPPDVGSPEEPARLTLEQGLDALSKAPKVVKGVWASVVKVVPKAPRQFPATVILAEPKWWGRLFYGVVSSGAKPGYELEWGRLLTVVSSVLEASIVHDGKGSKPKVQFTVDELKSVVKGHLSRQYLSALDAVDRAGQDQAKVQSASKKVDGLVALARHYGWKLPRRPKQAAASKK